METQFEYITGLAKKYSEINSSKDKLFIALNDLDDGMVREIFEDYGSTEAAFKPVNLLRAESARHRISGGVLTEDTIEEIKENIRRKNISSFSHYPKEYLAQIEAYEVGKRDMFANWQNLWSVFHTFFYRGKEKETTQQYLEQICYKLKEDLMLGDYTMHWVDFYGPSNFGSELAWLALYPEVKYSHKDAYQFFVRFAKESDAGRMAGHSLENPQKDDLKLVNSYAEIVAKLFAIKDTLVRLNKETRNYFKFAPGEQAGKWSDFYAAGVSKVNYSSLPIKDLKNVETLEQLNLAVGLSADSRSNRTWNLWLFKSAHVGDLVFANKGTNTCIGIGVITSDYEYVESPDGYSHSRKVTWLTNKVYTLKSGDLKGYKTLFRPDTFSPTKVWSFLLAEYARLYPEIIPFFEKYNIVYAQGLTKEDPEHELDADEETDIGFWWLNAKPTIWSISTFKEGDRQTYTARNEKGNKRRIYKHFESVKRGDLMIGYESSPVKQVKAIYEITKPLHTSEKQGEVFEFELLEKLDVPIHWNELVNNQELSKCEVFVNNQGSLFKLTEEEFDVIREVIDNKNITADQLRESSTAKVYDYTKDPDKPFLLEREFKQIINLLSRNKNIILQGPPGVGKTFIARKLAYEMLGYESDNQIAMVQFHQSYSYEDFIQGLRPSKNGFELKNGVFYNFCQTAQAHPERRFFFIIDEINRGNLSKVFGELLMLLEADKRGPKFALKLTYAEDESDTFFVPENLYLIGTMNTADRSLAIIDYALRRRFSFINLIPNFDTQFTDYLAQSGISEALSSHIVKSLLSVNKEIGRDKNLGPGFEIGHSYFCTYKNSMIETDWYHEVIEFQIRPLLEEIWFDNLQQAESMVVTLKAY